MGAIAITILCFVLRMIGWLVKTAVKLAWWITKVTCAIIAAMLFRELMR